MRELLDFDDVDLLIRIDGPDLLMVNGEAPTSDIIVKLEPVPGTEDDDWWVVEVAGHGEFTGSDVMTPFHVSLDVETHHGKQGIRVKGKEASEDLEWPE